MLQRQEWRVCEEGQEMKLERYLKVESRGTIKMSDISVTETESMGMGTSGWESKQKGSNLHLIHSLTPGGDDVSHNHRPEPQMDRSPEQVSSLTQRRVR